MASLFDNQPAPRNQPEPPARPDPRAAKLRAGLAHFTGTETWYRHWTGYALYTDGAKFLADTARAHWLLDLIASWQRAPAVRREPFQAWTLARDGHAWRVVADDGNGNEIAHQRVPYSDFPLDTITLYCEGDGDSHPPVILLPSEH